MLVVTNNQNERKEDAMTIPFNAPGGELEELLRGDFGKTVMRAVHEEDEHGYAFAVEILVSSILSPINADGDRALRWLLQDGMRNAQYREAAHAAREDYTRPTKFNGLGHWAYDNHRLRRQSRGYNPTGERKETIAQLDRTMSLHEKHEVVWRGVNVPTQEYRKGQILDEHHFTAASTSLSTAAEFAAINDNRGTYDTIFEIWIPPDVKTAVFNVGEQEVIIERFACYKVLSVDGPSSLNGTSMKQYIKLQAMPPIGGAS